LRIQLRHKSSSFRQQTGRHSGANHGGAGDFSARQADPYATPAAIRLSRHLPAELT
jgi:hypothetical protein